MEEIIYTSNNKVSCDGGDGSKGHPKIYLEVPEDPGFVICPYCSAKFVLQID